VVATTIGLRQDDLVPTQGCSIAPGTGVRRLSRGTGGQQRESHQGRQDPVHIGWTTSQGSMVPKPSSLAVSSSCDHTSAQERASRAQVGGG
jgi:hypothetical protein